MKMKCTNTKYGIVGCPSLAAFTIIVIIFIISSCSKSDTFSKEETPYHHNVLNDIYIAMAYNPDSALSMINDFSDSTDLKILKKAEFHEYNVLLAEARYKCNLENINDFELNEAVTFFDSIAELYPTDKEMLLQERGLILFTFLNFSLHILDRSVRMSVLRKKSFLCILTIIFP